MNLAKYIDLTISKSEATSQDIEGLCADIRLF